MVFSESEGGTEEGGTKEGGTERGRGMRGETDKGREGEWEERNEGGTEEGKGMEEGNASIRNAIMKDICYEFFHGNHLEEFQMIFM